MSGVTNMFDIRMVEQLSGLSRKAILSIMEQYATLKERYKATSRSIRSTSTKKLPIPRDGEP